MSKIEKDKSFQLPKDANALCADFDAHNGDFDTPEEFIRAYLNNDPRAQSALAMQNMEKLRDALEDMHPEIRKVMKSETSTPEVMKEYLDELANKKTPNPIP